MKSKWIILAVLTTALNSQAQQKHIFAGSDTLAGAVTDAIIQAGLDQSLAYIGGGSGTGEKNLLAGEQGIAPMSREIKQEAVNTLRGGGADVVGHVIALDGISVFVHSANSTSSLTVGVVTKIFSCEYTRWEQIQGSGLKGEIHVYRRNNESGTTDAFKNFTGLKNFGACVTMVNETADISDKTSHDSLAIGYSGLSGKVDGNRSVAIAANVNSAAVLPTTATIRDGSYPFARKLFIYEIKGTRHANEIEATFLSYVTDRSFMDPIVQAHEFITLD